MTDVAARLNSFIKDEEVPIRRPTALFADPDEPKTYNQLMKSENVKHWMKVMDEEYYSLIENETWILEKLPPGFVPLRHKWIGKYKEAYNGVEARWKARLTVVGSSQRHKIDFNETYAPVPKQSAIRIFLSYAAAMDLEMIQFDIKTAFLYATLKEVIYMTQPEGYVVKGKEDHYCRLLKSLYGLKQTPYEWNEEFNAFLIEFGLVRSESDPCIYTRRIGDEITIVVIYVDDGLIASNRPETIKSMIHHLEQKFQIRTLEPTRFVGLNLVRDRINRLIYIDQENTIDRMLNDNNMSDCKPVALPADPNSRLTAASKPESEEENQEDMAKVPYREAVGALLYLASTSRLDISYAVGQVSKYCACYTRAHWNAVKRIFAYLKGTKNLKLCYGGRAATFIAYCDADYGGDLDDRRSTTGFIFFYNGAPVCWASRKQPLTAQSSGESEYIAANEAAKEAAWFCQVVQDVTGSKVTLLMIKSDNEAAIAAAQRPQGATSGRMKHIPIKMNLVREHVRTGKINMEFVGTDDQLADIFTKPLKSPKFERMRERIGLSRRNL